jgi:hypothetical protein
MFRFLLRFLSLILLACGFSVFIIDASRSAAGQQLVVTSVAELVEALAKNPFGSLEQLVERFGQPWLWDPVLVHIMKLPAFALLCALALFLLWLARPPRPKFGIPY